MEESQKGNPLIPVQEMSVEDVKKFIEKDFPVEVAEKFEEQKIDGNAMMMLAKRATKEQYEACGLMTVSDQLKLTKLVNTAVDVKESHSCMTTAVQKKKPSKAQLKEVNEMNQRIYKTKRKAIRAAAIKRWPGNNLPKFKTNKVALEQLNQLVEELVPDCSFEPLNFGRDGIKQHILDVLNERRRHQRSGHDYTMADKRTLKRKINTGSPKATDNESASSGTESSSTSASAATCYTNLSVPLPVGEESSGDTEEVSDDEEGLPDTTANTVICVAYNAIKIADVARSQLQSSVKQLHLKNVSKCKDKHDLIHLVAKGLLDQGYLKIADNCTKPSRNDIIKLKPF